MKVGASLMSNDRETGLGQEVLPTKACHSIPKYTDKDAEITRLKNEVICLQRELKNFKSLALCRIQELIDELDY